MAYVQRITALARVQHAERVAILTVVRVRVLVTVLAQTDTRERATAALAAERLRKIVMYTIARQDLLALAAELLQ